jgi:hypothetical protein
MRCRLASTDRRSATGSHDRVVAGSNTAAYQVAERLVAAPGHSSYPCTWLARVTEDEIPRQKETLLQPRVTQCPVRRRPSGATEALPCCPAHGSDAIAPNGQACLEGKLRRLDLSVAWTDGAKPADSRGRSAGSVPGEAGRWRTSLIMGVIGRSPRSLLAAIGWPAPRFRSTRGRPHHWEDGR